MATLKSQDVQGERNVKQLKTLYYEHILLKQYNTLAAFAN